VRCEVCGRRIHGRPHKVMIEGAKLTVCRGCAKLGTTLWEEPEPKASTAKYKKTATPPTLITMSREPQRILVDVTLELVEHFSAKIRQAREKLGFSHEDLGKKIAEKASVLKKIETGKMVPDNKLTSKLEHALKIKLLVPAKKEKITQMETPKTPSRELTLGDLVRLDKRKTEDKKKRKQS
jgi:putative transcription factor